MCDEGILQDPSPPLLQSRPRQQILRDPDAHLEMLPNPSPTRPPPSRQRVQSTYLQKSAPESLDRRQRRPTSYPRERRRSQQVAGTLTRPRAHLASFRSARRTSSCKKIIPITFCPLRSALRSAGWVRLQQAASLVLHCHQSILLRRGIHPPSGHPTMFPKPLPQCAHPPHPRISITLHTSNRNHRRNFPRLRQARHGDFRREPQR